MDLTTLEHTPAGGWSAPLPDLDSPQTLVLAFAAAEHRDDPGSRVYVWLYGAIAAAMIVAGVVMIPFGSRWSHMVLVLEATQITLFAAFWLVQTRQHWNETN